MSTSRSVLLVGCKVTAAQLQVKVRSTLWLITEQSFCEQTIVTFVLNRVSGTSVLGPTDSCETSIGRTF